MPTKCVSPLFDGQLCQHRGYCASQSSLTTLESIVKCIEKMGVRVILQCGILVSTALIESMTDLVISEDISFALLFGILVAFLSLMRHQNSNLRHLATDSA